MQDKHSISFSDADMYHVGKEANDGLSVRVFCFFSPEITTIYLYIYLYAYIYVKEKDRDRKKERVRDEGEI